MDDERTQQQAAAQAAAGGDAAEAAAGGVAAEAAAGAAVTAEAERDDEIGAAEDLLRLAGTEIEGEDGEDGIKVKGVKKVGQYLCMTEANKPQNGQIVIGLNGADPPFVIPKTEGGDPSAGTRPLQPNEHLSL
jgi:hypothetical protein